ncbi:hypothetical protein HZB02_02395 [Candidatus Woesearchaeota archaeon]|nr:hypothetical protein [Candidatus Woesearchaeota archaeon]
MSEETIDLMTQPLVIRLYPESNLTGIESKCQDDRRKGLITIADAVRFAMENYQKTSYSATNYNSLKKLVDKPSGIKLVIGSSTYGFKDLHGTTISTPPFLLAKHFSPQVDRDLKPYRLCEMRMMDVGGDVLGGLYGSDLSDRIGSK